MLAGAGPRSQHALGARFALAGTTLLAACSALPQPSRPAFLDHHVAADFVVPASGQLRLPTSGGDLVVVGLDLQPPPEGERFRGDERWFVYAPGTRVVVQGRFRTYGSAERPPADAAAVLRGAAAVRSVDTP